MVFFGRKKKRNVSTEGFTRKDKELAKIVMLEKRAKISQSKSIERNKLLARKQKAKSLLRKSKKPIFTQKEKQIAKRAGKGAAKFLGNVIGNFQEQAAREARPKKRRRSRPNRLF